jgi:hypothetical protein
MSYNNDINIKNTDNSKKTPYDDQNLNVDLNIFSWIGPIFKSSFIAYICYLIIKNHSLKHHRTLVILFFGYAVGCFLNSIKYYYTEKHCINDNFLNNTRIDNIFCGTLIMFSIAYAVILNK